MELAAELRAGQAVRGHRSDLNLGPVAGFGLGRFVIHGAGKKLGEVVDLHPELRALVDHMLTNGYLSEAEAAYQRGELADYYLFPAGRLKNGEGAGRSGGSPAARAHGDPQDVLRGGAVGRGGALAGRAFYGLRRQATDLAPEFAQDAKSPGNGSRCRGST